MLNTKEVTLRFGGLYAVNNVSLEVKKNSITALIGPNGAGKTTLFNIVSGVYKPLSGEIVFKGESIASLPPHKINEKGIARTYQNINLETDKYL
jgi:branched-chain amino acid transport system ATP-binding protein